MYKKESGITLVALVVTIIIMLILAGVALTLALGDNGLFHQAKNAATTHEQAAANEANELNEATSTINNLIAEYFPAE